MSRPVPLIVSAGEGIFGDAPLSPPPLLPPQPTSSAFTTGLASGLTKSNGTDKSRINSPEWFAQNSLGLSDDVLARLRYVESRIYSQYSEKYKAAHEQMEAKLKQEMQARLRDELASVVQAQVDEKFASSDASAEKISDFPVFSHQFFKRMKQRDMLNQDELKLGLSGPDCSTLLAAASNFCAPDFVHEGIFNPTPAVSAAAVGRAQQFSTSENMSDSAGLRQRQNARRHRPSSILTLSSLSDIVLEAKANSRASYQRDAHQVTVRETEESAAKFQTQSQSERNTHYSQPVTRNNEAEDDSDIMSSILVLGSHTPSVQSYATSVRTSASWVVTGDVPNAAGDYMVFKDQRIGYNASASKAPNARPPSPLLPVVVHSSNVHSSELDTMQISDTETGYDDNDDDFEDDVRAFEQLYIQNNENDQWIVGPEAVLADLITSVSSGTTTTDSGSEYTCTNISVQNGVLVENTKEPVYNEAEQNASKLMSDSFILARLNMLRSAEASEKGQNIHTLAVNSDNSEGRYEPAAQQVVDTNPILALTSGIPADGASSMLGDGDHVEQRWEMYREIDVSSVFARRTSSFKNRTEPVDNSDIGGCCNKVAFNNNKLAYLFFDKVLWPLFWSLGVLVGGPFLFMILIGIISMAMSLTEE